jgi:hypothetical protein
MTTARLAYLAALATLAAFEAAQRREGAYTPAVERYRVLLTLRALAAKAAARREAVA